jgi:hypothetical protein
MKDLEPNRWYSYAELVESFDVQVLAELSEEWDSIDTLFFLKKDNLYALLPAWTEDLDTLDDIYDDEDDSSYLERISKYRSSIWSNISWKSRDDMVNSLNDPDFGLGIVYDQEDALNLSKKLKRAMEEK